MKFDGSGELPMKPGEFPYAAIPEYQKWSSISAVPDRRSLSPQGPVKFTLSRSSKIASAGSCFAQRIAERLSGLGLTYFVAEQGAAPYAARYGNVYSSIQLQQLLERALGLFDPLERAWTTQDGRFLDPFRPGVEAAGFASVDALEEDRRKHLSAVSRLFRELDVFVFTLGLSEVWYDRRDGAVFPACPGRGRGEFDPDRHVFRNLDVAETCDGLERFLGLLGDLNPAAKVILSVSPVAIAATMEPMHVVRASILSKSILKVAAETTARRHEHVDYFASFDLVMQNLGAEKLFAEDGRHVVDEVAERVTRLLADSYFGGAVNAVEKPRLSQFDPDCDEDRLLGLIATERASSSAPPISSVKTSRVADPIPVYIAGDSGTLTFRDGVFQSPLSNLVFLGRVLYTPALYARELVDGDGHLNPALATQLVQSQVLRRPEPNVYYVNDQVEQQLRRPENRLRFNPPLVLCCGAFDCLTLMEEIDWREVELPPELRPKRFAKRATRIDEVPFVTATGIGFDLLEPFARGLKLLRSFGLRTILVHGIVPPNPSVPFGDGVEWGDPTYMRYSTAIVLNHCLRSICEKLDVPFVDVWPHVVDENGLREARYSLDADHLNFEAAELSMDQILAEIIRDVQTPTHLSVLTA